MQERTSVQRLAVALLAAVMPCMALGAESLDEDEELEPVVVTGSHIPTIQREGPSPVTRITSEDFDARGFTTVDEALNSLTQITGVAQNETMAGTFTQNANSLALRDLGPGHTLVLVDGHRMAEYPMPYNSESNFVNLSAIPAAAIDYIELLSSGASAIYGSDAVAGVVNIVLKKKLDDPFSLNLRYGDTSQGGGQSGRAQMVTGFDFGRLSTLFAAEVFVRKPVYAYQRSFQDSTLDNPDPAGRIAGRAVLWHDWYYDAYVDPGPTACDAFPNLTYEARPNRGYDPDEPGYFCGDYQSVSQYTLQNARSRGSLFSRFTYSLDASEIYATVNLLGTSDRYDPDYTWFNSDFALPEFGYWDVSTDPNGDGGVFSTMQRFFQPYEAGGYKGRQYRDHERVIDVTAGIRGDVSSDWRYDLTLANSRYNFRESAPSLLTQPMVNYFMGPQLKDTNGNPLYDPYFDYYPVYNPDWNRVYEPVSRETYDSFLGIQKTRAFSQSRTATLVVNGPLFALPSGMLETAVVVEAAKQEYDITLDERLLAGEFFGLTGTGGGGKRNRYAAGLEFRVPVLDPLTLSLAARYDRYDDITEVKGALTYNVGLEYRPIRQLLVRGRYATSFRAPDMHYVFADPSGYFTFADDEYLCRRDEPGVPIASCTNAEVSIEGGRQGNPFLKEETSDSYTFGFVVQPLRNLVVSADYYYIRLEDAVQDDSIDMLLETEADCRLGMTAGGDPVDIGSLQCQSALARVQRHADDGTALAEQLEKVTTGPINASLTRTSGIDASVSYGLSAGSIGTFDFTANFSHVLTYKFQEFAGDPVENYLKDLQYFGWHDRMSGSVTWRLGQFSTTAFVQRFGSTPNWAETGRLGSWTTTNLSARYSGLMGGETYVGLAISNLLNRKPPRDPTFDSYPYYSDFNYDPIGREIFLEVGTRF